MNTRLHNASTYSNHRCRCDECRKSWTDYTKRRQSERHALRIEIDGKLVAAHLPEEQHGRENTYGNHGCRCRPCTDAWATACRERNARRKGVAA